MAETGCLLPPAIAAMGVKPAECRLTARNDDNQHKTLYTFSVSWFGDNGSVEGGRIENRRTSRTESSTRLSCSNGDLPSDVSRVIAGAVALTEAARKESLHNAVNKRSIRGPVPKSAGLWYEAKSTMMDPSYNYVLYLLMRLNEGGDCSSVRALPDQISCDGPCGKSYAPSLVRTFGRCGHYLCRLCCGLVYNIDGTPGCSSFQCAYNQLFNYMNEETAREAYNSMIKNRYFEKERRVEKGDCQLEDNLSWQPSRTCSNAQIPFTQHNVEQKSLRGASSTTAGRGSSLFNTTKQSCDQSERSTSNCTGSSDVSEYANGSQIPGAPSRRKPGKTQSVTGLFSDLALTKKCELPAGQNEMIFVRLMVFDKDAEQRIRRMHLGSEVFSSMSVKEVIDRILEGSEWGLIDHKCPSRVFHCAGSSAGGLTRISNSELETTKLFRFPVYNGSVHFVLDQAQYIRQSK